MRLKLAGAVAPIVVVLMNLHLHASAEQSPKKSIVLNSKFTIEERAILDIKKPGYLSFVSDPVTRAPHLLISSFQAFGKDTLTSITGWDKGLATPQLLDTAILNSEITWPNEARLIDSKIFPSEGLLVSGGFLVPGKSTGAVTFVPWNHPDNALTLTTAKKGWYYHRTEEWDVNNDGLMDIVTARGTIPMMGKPDGELLWLENPGEVQLNVPWQEHIIARGPDVHFRILNHALTSQENKTPLTIIATEFSARKMTAFRQTAGGSFERTILDDTLGAAFDIQLEDLNADGRIDLLVTNHEPDSKASVFGYEIDSESLKIIKRHTLLTGIETRQKGIKQASPGTILAFHPVPGTIYAQAKPWILVSGDGSQRAHLLIPKHESDEQSWEYHEHIIWDAQSTVGQSAIGDLDGDGRVEIMIPAYDKNEIAVFTVTPHKSQSPRPR
jgi:hypothetical protein